MIRFEDPATSESPAGTLPTRQRSSEDLTPAPLEAILRAFDEVLADARRLRAGLVPPECVRDQ
jgi:hypothetical protein